MSRTNLLGDEEAPPPTIAVQKEDVSNHHHQALYTASVPAALMVVVPQGWVSLGHPCLLYRVCDCSDVAEKPLLDICSA